MHTLLIHDRMIEGLYVVAATAKSDCVSALLEFAEGGWQYLYENVPPPERKRELIEGVFCDRGQYEFHILEDAKRWSPNDGLPSPTEIPNEYDYLYRFAGDLLS